VTKQVTMSENQDKRSYPRPNQFGLLIKNPPKEVADPIFFLNSAITQTEHLMSRHKIKEVSFIVLEATTAVMIRTSDQKYLNGWKRLARDVFSDASKTLGEDVIVEMSDESSEKIKKIFREQKRINSSLIHPFEVITHH
jgi:hypothetical protein